MKDKLPLIAIISMVILAVLVVTGIYMVQSGSYQKSVAEVNQEISDAQKKIDEVTASKDSNNFTPTEVVTSFLTEVKSDADVNAKLYLDSTLQDMDIKNTLKLGSDLANLTIGESEQTIEGDMADVRINLEVSGEQVARTFSLEKVSDVWKIKGIVAE